MRKLLLPALASCVLLAASAPVASAAKAHSSASATSFILTKLKTHSSEIGALQDLATGFKAAFASLNTSVSTILAGVPTIVNGLTALKDGLTTLAAAVQGPGVAGQLGAAGSADPGASNTATPSTLPAGTIYRQIVIATGGALNTAPIGARTYVRMPDVAAVGYNNTWVCTGAGTSAAANNVGGSGHGYDVTCSGGAAAFGH
jgi:hypothetical protein